ncbi:MAG: septation protein IspZ [Hyphomicrobiaceae bacterium]|nr:septation protein IspZ [Hyphomicrobiaceae bacterium]
MVGKRRWFPFNLVQTLNIASEIGPLVTMFVVNFAAGVEAGVWALIGTTGLALIASLVVLRRPPIMPFIAGAVTVGFGALTLVTGDPKWVQIKVTIFNALIATVLFVGVYYRKYFFEFVFGKTFHYSEQGWRLLTRNAAVFFLVTAIANEAVRLGFATAQIPCPTTWAWLLRKPVLDGLDIWMIFKLFIVMPFTTLYFVLQVRLLQKHRLPDKV